MVAYSFKARFAEPIIARTKRQTIRGTRRRHARPGEALQLYVGMRTKTCRKLLNIDPECSGVVPAHLTFDRNFGPQSFRIDDREILTNQALDEFARRDGFDDIEDMTRFWFDTHASRGARQITFDGVVISWDPEEPS